MKQCGYRIGYCESKGECALGPPPYFDGPQWTALHTVAGRCRWYLTPAARMKRSIRIHQRRRDWKVGNPHDRT